MFGNSTHAGPARRKGAVARMALAAALASGMVLGSAALSAPAFAKDKKDDKKAAEGNSKGFAEVYEPIGAMINAPDADLVAAKAQVPTVVAAIENDFDRHTAGQMVLVLGNKLTDKTLQRQGLEMMLASGKVDPVQVGQLQFYVGSIAYQQKDWEAARTALKAAAAAGYAENDLLALIAESYFAEGQPAQGLRWLSDLIETTKAAGKPVPEDWIVRGLKIAYDAKLAQPATDYSAMLVETHPTAENWGRALQVIAVLNPVDQQAELDLLRLMRTTGSMSQRNEYVQYVETATSSGLPNEVLAVLEEGKTAGVFNDADGYYKDVQARASGRAAEDRKEVPTLVAEARSAASGQTALGVAEAFLSFGAYAEAADMYQVAIDKGVKDPAAALTRLGIAQAQAGNYDAAKVALEKVTGPRQAIAKMWLAYVDTKAA